MQYGGAGIDAGDQLLGVEGRAVRHCWTNLLAVVLSLPCMLPMVTD